MIALGDRRDGWVGLSSWPWRFTRAQVGKAQTHLRDKMALFSECMRSCAQIVLDTADIVRDGDVTTTVQGRSTRRDFSTLSGCNL